MKKKLPKRRSLEAKLLSLPQYRQQRIGKKAKELKEKDRTKKAMYNSPLEGN